MEKIQKMILTREYIEAAVDNRRDVIANKMAVYTAHPFWFAASSEEISDEIFDIFNSSYSDDAYELLDLDVPAPAPEPMPEQKPAPHPPKQVSAKDGKGVKQIEFNKKHLLIAVCIFAGGLIILALWKRLAK